MHRSLMRPVPRNQELVQDLYSEISDEDEIDWILFNEFDENGNPIDHPVQHEDADDSDRAVDDQ